MPNDGEDHISDQNWTHASSSSGIEIPHGNCPSSGFASTSASSPGPTGLPLLRVQLRLFPLSHSSLVSQFPFDLRKHFQSWPCTAPRVPASWNKRWKCFANILLYPIPPWGRNNLFFKAKIMKPGKVLLPCLQVFWFMSVLFFITACLFSHGGGWLTWDKLHWIFTVIFSKCTSSNDLDR